MIYDVLVRPMVTSPSRFDSSVVTFGMDSTANYIVMALHSRPRTISADSAETFFFKHTRRHASPTTESRSPHHIPYFPGARNVLADALSLSLSLSLSLVSRPAVSRLNSPRLASPLLASLLFSHRLAIHISRRSIHQRRPWPRVCIIVVGCIYSRNDGVPLCCATTTLLPDCGVLCRTVVMASIVCSTCITPGTISYYCWPTPILPALLSRSSLQQRRSSI
jgi:hypothetical protein